MFPQIEIAEEMAMARPEEQEVCCDDTAGVAAAWAPG